MKYFFFTLLMFMPFLAQAQETKFIMPLACDYGQDCWSVNYVDVAPGEDVQDFKCNRKSYDGHKGTDFALGSIARMERGVDVLAAADGTVLRVRDGQSDTLKDEDALAAIKKENKDCGNGVLIDHGDGLNTIYCHLKKGSVVVKAKQKVKAGTVIAQIGQSGVAEFPHLHFGVQWEGAVIDPFTGESSSKGCGVMKAPMWHAGLPIVYEPVAIFDGGFRSAPPDFAAIRKGEDNPVHIDLSSAGFVFWSGFYNVEDGDVVDLIVHGPDGKVFVTRRDTVPKTRARQYYFTGRKIGRVQLQEGTYRGLARITRGDLVRERVFRVLVK